MSSTPRTLLHVDASPRGQRSYSRKLGATFVAAWRLAHADASVITRDLGRDAPPFVSADWVEGAFAPADQQSPAAREAIRISDRYVDELLAADEIVITTPMYNLSLPAVLKAWIDQIVRVGRTFAKKDGSLQGLTRGKRAVVIVASGSDFRPTSAAAAHNFLEPYLRAVLGFIGITSVEFVYAHSLGAAPDLIPQTINEAETALSNLVVGAAA